MILYIMNIPTTWERKNKQPHRKMGKESNKQFMKKETQSAHKEKVFGQLKYLIKIIIECNFSPNRLTKGKKAEKNKYC